MDENFFDENAKIIRSSVIICSKEPEKQNMVAFKVSGLVSRNLLIKYNKARLRQLKFFQKKPNFKEKIPIEKLFRKYETLSKSKLSAQEKMLFQNDIFAGETLIDYATWRYKVHPILIFNEFGSQHPIFQYFGQFTQKEVNQISQLAQRFTSFCDCSLQLSTKLIVDAEQTYLQEAIDSLYEQLQAKYNKNEVIVINTLQNYLKSAGFRMDYELEKSQRFGLFIAFKMVRGAYMVEESRLAQEGGYENPICNSFEETSDMYNNNCLKYFKHAQLQSQLLVASHNSKSCELVSETMKSFENEQWKDSVSFAQLYGLSDHLTAKLKSQGQRVYKYAPFGSVDILMPYLIRRAQEQNSMLEGIGIQRNLLLDELKRRFKFGKNI